MLAARKMAYFEEDYFEQQIASLTEARIAGWEKQVRILKSIRDLQIIVKESVGGGDSQVNSTIMKCRLMTEKFSIIKRDLEDGNYASLEDWLK